MSTLLYIFHSWIVINFITIPCGILNAAYKPLRVTVAKLLFPCFLLSELLIRFLSMEI